MMDFLREWDFWLVFWFALNQLIADGFWFHLFLFIMKLTTCPGLFKLSCIINNPITISNCFPLKRCGAIVQFFPSFQYACVFIGHSWVSFCITKRYRFYFILRSKSFSFNRVLLNIFHIWIFRAKNSQNRYEIAMKVEHCSFCVALFYSHGLSHFFFIHTVLQAWFL